MSTQKIRRRAAKTKTSPIRLSLADDSFLHSKVSDGIQAVATPHRKHLEAEIRDDFGDSLDLDRAIQPGHEEENRWDYLLGHLPSGAIVALEPHSAKRDQISTVIRKKETARVQLQGHLKPEKHVARWLWVASNKVHFANTEKARRRLDQKGIQFVGTRVLAKHLADLKA